IILYKKLYQIKINKGWKKLRIGRDPERKLVRPRRREGRERFVLFNFYGLIVYYCITYLNVYILFCIVFMYYMAFLFCFCFLLDFILFGSLLVGDAFMDVFFLRYLLCVLECFSLLCRCISTFLRMFCNLLSSHFLMLMFCDFVYFFIIFFLFFIMCDFIYFIIFTFAMLFCIIFYLFLYALDMFCALLQIFIFCNMIMQLIMDFLLLLSFH
nr:hypothetical protein (CYb-COII intergenic region) - Leishmania tarentolae mitochondrion [Leishmania tarentolae]